MNLSEFLVFISENALSESVRFLKPGCNGPYNDFETPVRNYGHWLITFSKCYEINQDKKFLNKVKEFAEYLISNDSRPSGYAFHHRNSPNWDKCNGLIGQAWTFEALACASSVLNNTKYAEVAEKVFVWKYIGNEEINPKYKGEVKDNQPDGMGITIFPDGYRHSGQYKKGKRHGSGTWFTKKSGKINKHSKGEWKHGYFWDMITYDFDGEVRDKYKDGLLIYGVLFTN